MLISTKRPKLTGNLVHVRVHYSRLRRLGNSKGQKRKTNDFALALWTKYNVAFKLPNHNMETLTTILHGLIQVGSTRGWRGGGHKVPAAFFSETVKAIAKLYW